MFVIVLVELTNTVFHTVFVNSTNVTRSIETAVLSSQFLRIWWQWLYVARGGVAKKNKKNKWYPYIGPIEQNQ